MLRIRGPLAVVLSLVEVIYDFEPLSDCTCDNSVACFVFVLIRGRKKVLAAEERLRGEKKKS